MRTRKLIVSIRRLAGFLWDRTRLGASLLWHPEMGWLVWVAAICFFIAVMAGGYALFLGDPSPCATFVKDEGCLVWNWSPFLWSKFLSGISITLTLTAGTFALATLVAMWFLREERGSR